LCKNSVPARLENSLKKECAMNKKNNSRSLPRKLIVLIYSENRCYPEVVGKLVPGLEIIFYGNKPIGWRYANPDDWPTIIPETRDIGKFNYNMQNCARGVIGVYDKNQDKHLTQMMRDWMDICDRDY
jgi:hypothetical protein